MSKKGKVLDDDEAPVKTKKPTKIIDDDDAPLKSKPSKEPTQPAVVAAVLPAAHVDPSTTSLTEPPPTTTIRRAQRLAEISDSATLAPQDSAYSRPDYDAMTYEDFLAHLKAKSKSHTVSEKKIYEDSVADRDRHKTAQVLEQFNDHTGGYTYKCLLGRVFDEIRKRRGDHEQDTVERFKIPTPVVEKVGTKKTAIGNFGEICMSLHRSPKEVQSFIEGQLSTTSAIDSDLNLILRMQNMKVQGVENILSKYVNEYVICNNCHSLDTSLLPEPNRLVQLKCNGCNATRYVSVTGAQGYIATTTKRSQRRNNQFM